MIFYAMNYYKFREFSFRKKYLQKKKSKCFNFKIKHFSNHYTALALHFKEVKKWLPPSSILIWIFFSFSSLRLPKMQKKQCKSVCQSSSASSPASILSKNSLFLEGGHFDNPCFLLNLHLQHTIIFFLLILWNLMLPLKKN